MATAKNAWLADPGKYDLLRVRRAAWAEFFVTMFQAQHQCRLVELLKMPIAAKASGAHE
jgi:hypothetical protein